jgi:hypothetical protein
MLSLQDVLADPDNQFPDQEFHRCSVSPDHLVLRLLYLNTHREDPGNAGTLYLGFLIQNDEIGMGRLKAHLLLWNHGCTNAIRVGEGVEITHQYRNVGAGEWMKTQLLGALGQIAQTGPEYMERLFAAHYKALPKLGGIIAALAKEYNWKPEFANAVGIGTNGEETVGGLINGITAATQTIESPVLQVRWETLAGELLVDDSGLFRLAEKLARNETADIRIR